MKLNELRQSWTKSDPLTLIHKILPDTKIQLVPAEAGRRGRHFIARVNGEWIMQSTWIRPFRTLDDAAKAVDEAAQLDAQAEGDPNYVLFQQNPAYYAGRGLPDYMRDDYIGM